MAETLKIKITLPVPKTKDLIPPELQAECEITMDADQDHERIKWDYYKKNYEKLFTQKLKDQIKHMIVPLSSMQKEIDALRSDYEKATSSTDYLELKFPRNSGHLEKPKLYGQQEVIRCQRKKERAIPANSRSRPCD